MGREPNRRKGCPLENQKQNFVGGALILMLSGFAVKVIGLVFKLPLGNLLGMEGMFYFSAGFEIYNWMFTIATSGLPVAMSKLVAEYEARGEPKRAGQLTKLSFLAFGLIGLLGSLALFFFARPLARMMGNENAVWCIAAIAPSIIFEAFTSTYRGYFQGRQNMVPTAVSQTLAALCRMALGIALGWYLMGKGYSLSIVAAGSILGTTLGSVLSTLYLAWKKRREKAPLPPARLDSAWPALLKRLFALAIPVSIGASVMSITNLLDLAVVTNRLLPAGFTLEAATQISGAYTGYAKVIFQLPSALITSLGVSLLPALSAKQAEGNRAGVGLVSKTLRYTVLLALPASFGMAVLARPILALLYSDPQTVELAAPLLAELGPSILLVSLASITGNILQGLGRQNLPVYAMLAGCGVKLVVNYALAAVPAINIHAAPLGTFLCYGLISAVNLYYVCKLTGWRPRLKSAVLKPMAASIACGGAAFLGYWGFSKLLGDKLGVLLAVCLAAAVYLGLCMLLRCLTGQDLASLPGGGKLMELARKFRGKG